MLTNFKRAKSDNRTRRGWKTFVFGAPTANLRGRWLRSTQGPGFHIFKRKKDAVDYARGLDFSVVERVQYRHVLLEGDENGAPAITAEYLYIYEQEEGPW